MDAALTPEEYDGELIAGLFKQKRQCEMAYRLAHGKAMIQAKLYDEHGEKLGRPTSDGVARAILEKDEDLNKLFRRKRFAEDQIKIMYLILGRDGIATDEEDNDE